MDKGQFMVRVTFHFAALLRAMVRPVAMTGLLFCLMTPVSLHAAGHKLRVDDPAVAKAIQDKGGKLIADYGGYQLLEIEDAKEFLQHTGVAARDEENVIELHARRIDTRAPETQRLRGQARQFAGRQLHLVQFAGPVKPEWHAALRDTGVEIVSYIPHNAYLVSGDAAALGRLQDFAKNSAPVQWEGEFKDSDKIHPHALAQAGDFFTVQLHADADANPATLQLIDRWKREPVLRQHRVLNYVNVTVRLPPERLAEIAARPDVVSIHPFITPQKRDERQDQILAGNISGNGPSGPGYLAWLGGIGFTQAQFTASSFIVDLTDSGIDDGATTPHHPGLFVNGNSSSNSRVSYVRLVGTANAGSTKKGCDGHGTLNAHIIAGFNNLSGFPHTDGAGFHYGLGVCPFVKLGSSVIFDPNDYTFPNFKEVQSRAYNSGARISSNSWGSDSGGIYDADDQAYDALVRDAQPASAPVFPTAGNQQMVIIFSAGNAGPGAQSIGSPGSAKNVITVGASESVQAFGGADGSGVDDTGANNFNDLIYFSSRGPCADGRIKPDLVAPGTHVSGGVAQAAAPGTNGTADSCYTGGGISGGIAPSVYFPAGQQWYTASSGTSHAAPAVSGGAALLRQFFINHGTNPPSPALTKAWLVNSARRLTGLYANDTLPSNNQGMGEMNLGTAFDNVTRITRDQLAPDKFTGSGQSRIFTGQITDTNQPFRITLAWTDAPGSTVGNAYNNDLDLTVVIGGQSYHGNVFNGGISVAGGSSDTRNNLESVFLPAGTAGKFSVVVSAANINSDGVPNDADLLDQDFALVIYNALPAPLPVIAANGFTLAAENCAPGNGGIDPGETVTVNLFLKNFGSLATTNLTATLLATGGVTYPSAAQNYGALTTNGASVSRPFTFTASGPCGGIINARLHLLDGTNDLGTVPFTFNLGVSNAVHTFTSPGLITILDAAPAAPYPSTNFVSGLTGTVSKVTVTLNNLNHTFPKDLDILLVGPGGQNVVLMSHAGSFYDLINVTLTFDDTAAAPPPNLAQIVSGIYQPVNYTSSYTFPAPAPAAPWGANLSVFNGVNPNGAWKLFVVDDAGSDFGNIASGWSLALTTGDGLTCCQHILGAPKIVSTTNSGGNIFFSFASEPGASYFVEGKDSLSVTNWQLLQTLTGDGTLKTLSYPIHAPQQRFYRLRAQ